jgi:glutamyl-tRNA synthetase
MKVPELTDAILPSLISNGLVSEVLPEGGIEVQGSRTWLERLVSAMQERLNLLGELPEKAGFLFSDEVELDSKAAKAVRAEGANSLLSSIADALQAEQQFPPADWFAWVKVQAETLGVGVGKVMKPLRAALSGTLGGPDLADILTLLGKQRSLARIRAVLMETPST